MIEFKKSDFDLLEQDGIVIDTPTHEAIYAAETNAHYIKVTANAKKVSVTFSHTFQHLTRSRPIADSKNYVDEAVEVANVFIKEYYQAITSVLVDGELQ